MTESLKRDYECCRFVPDSMDQWRQEQGRNERQKYQICRKATLFSSLLAKSKPVNWVDKFVWWTQFGWNPKKLF